jgi:hypothetical protein
MLALEGLYRKNTVTRQKNQSILNSNVYVETAVVYHHGKFILLVTLCSVLSITYVLYM